MVDYIQVEKEFRIRNELTLDILKTCHIRKNLATSFWGLITISVPIWKVQPTSSQRCIRTGVEIGKNKNKLQTNERLCSKCNEIDHEIHFISRCTLFDTVRENSSKKSLRLMKHFPG